MRAVLLLAFALGTACEVEPTPLDRLDALGGLEVLEAVLDGYDRDAWKHWTDDDGTERLSGSLGRWRLSWATRHGLPL